MESELFGHEKGRIHRRRRRPHGPLRAGRRRLDPARRSHRNRSPLQAKLLRVLQEQSFERVGSSNTLRSTSACWRRPTAICRPKSPPGGFATTCTIAWPWCRWQSRRCANGATTCRSLSHHFARLAAERFAREPITLDAGACDLLANYHWPGNVRELENLITRASVLGGPKLDADELRPWLIDPSAADAPDNTTDDADTAEPTFAVGLSLQDMERKLIEATLNRFAGHRAKAAAALGIGIRTLSGKLREYGYAPRAKEFAKAA